MASRATSRATDPVIGRGLLKNAVIELDGARSERQGARTRELNMIAQGRDLSSGYIALMRDNTLAGRTVSRNVSRNFMREQEVADLSSASRLRQVRRLRKKENWLMWKYLFHDINRAVGSFFSRLSPSQLFKPRTNQLNYEEELAKYLQRVELQKDLPQLTCYR